jgi:DNA-binding GntR family transcriptional regulator
MTHDDIALPLPRIEHRILRQEVLVALRTAILRGRFAPGDRLLETDVAARMGVSRAPVREALRQLEQEGLVESQAHRGAVVRGLPEDEIEAIYGLRAHIESKAIERVCLAATADEVAYLDGLVQEMRTALEAEDTAELADLDLRFHRSLIELSGFRLLGHIWSSLDGLVRAKAAEVIEQPTPGANYFLAASATSHALLVDAIRGGDAAIAMARVQEHILEVPERLRAGQERSASEAEDA